MAHLRTWPYSRSSVSKAAALAALIGAAWLAKAQEPAPPQAPSEQPAAQQASAAGEQPWSEPVVNTYTPQPGVTERVEISKRTYKEAPTQRTLEQKTRVDLESPGWSGEYTLSRKHVYSHYKLLTAYRKMEAELRGQSNLSISEQTQIGKDPRGEYKGTFVREYFFLGREAPGPAIRLMVHFDPYLLVRRFSAKIFVRKEDGTWPELSAVYAETFNGGIKALGKKTSALGEGQKAPPADFLMALWAGSMARGNMMELAQFLYPLLNPGGEKLFQGVDTDLVLDRAQGTLAALGTRNDDLGQWQSLSKSLSQVRSTLDKAIRKKGPPAGELKGMAQSYESNLQPLLTPKEGAPSPVQGLQATASWMASAYAQFSTLQPGTTDYRNFIAALPDSWAGALAEQKAEIFVRALYAMLTTKELKQLDSMIADADKAAGLAEVASALRRVRESLAQSAQAWRTPLARRSPSYRATGPFLALGLPLNWLIGEAWAQPPEGHGYESLMDVLNDNFPDDPMAKDALLSALVEEGVDIDSAWVETLQRAPGAPPPPLNADCIQL